MTVSSQLGGEAGNTDLTWNQLSSLFYWNGNPSCKGPHIQNIYPEPRALLLWPCVSALCMLIRPDNHLDLPHPTNVIPDLPVLVSGTGELSALDWGAPRSSHLENHCRILTFPHSSGFHKLSGEKNGVVLCSIQVEDKTPPSQKVFDKTFELILGTCWIVRFWCFLCPIDLPLPWSVAKVWMVLTVLGDSLWNELNHHATLYHI